MRRSRNGGRARRRMVARPASWPAAGGNGRGYHPAVESQTAKALLAAAKADRAALRGTDADAARARLEAAYPAYAEAFDFFVANGQAEDAVQLASDLVPFWMATKRIDDGDRWLTRAIDAADADGLKARALYQLGYLIFWTGDDERSGKLSRQAVDLATIAGDTTTRSLALSVLARIALRTDVEAAIDLLREAIAVTDGTSDRDGRSSAMHVLGVALQMSGRFEEAAKVMSDRIALGREMGNDYLIAIESGNLSMVERQLGNLDHAEALSRESLEIMSRRGDALAIPWIVNGLAAVTAEQGNLERAAILNGFAAAGIERAGGEWPPDERIQYDGTLARISKGMSPEEVDRARAIGQAMATDEAVEFALSRPGSTVTA